MKVLMVFGPNLGTLGSREPEKYGSETLPELAGELTTAATDLGHDLTWRQSDVEGDVLDWIGAASDEGFESIIINPAALTHHSFALREAISGCGVPVIEVHQTNIYGREEFRRHSVVSPACQGVIAGLGTGGYRLALEALTWIT